MLVFKLRILGSNQADPNEGINCLNQKQQAEIVESLYITSDESDSTSILNTSKNLYSNNYCKFLGNLDDGFVLKVNSNEW